MVVAFTDKEKELIREKLIKEAKECLKNYGVKKTTVDELVNRVGISKGAFYKFYKSKEILFFDVFNDFEAELRIQMKEKVLRAGEITKEAFVEILCQVYLEVKNSFILTLFAKNEIEYLMRKLPDEVLKDHYISDNQFVEQLLSLIKMKENQDIVTISTAFRGVFMTLLFADEIGDNYEAALKLMIKGIIEVIWD